MVRFTSPGSVEGSAAAPVSRGGFVQLKKDGSPFAIRRLLQRICVNSEGKVLVKRNKILVVVSAACLVAACKPPRLDGISPERGTPDGADEVVTIQGAELDDVTEAHICGEAATIVSQTSTSLLVRVPAIMGYTGPCDVTATNPYGTGTLAQGFHYFDRSVHVGVLPNPTPLEGPLDAIVAASVASDVTPVWGGPTAWWEMTDWLNEDWGGEGTYVDLLRAHGIEPIVVLAAITGATKNPPPECAGDDDDDLSSRCFIDRLTEEAVAIATDHQPRYMMIGNEVNTFWETHHGDPTADDDDFEHFVAMFAEVRSAVIYASPNTMVFPSFSYNRLVHPSPDWAPVHAFDEVTVDLMVFTTYPFMSDETIFSSPWQIPNDYYYQAKSELPNATFAFTEVVWSSEECGGTEEEQAEFVDLFFQLTSAMPREFVAWGFFNDFELPMETSPGVWEIVYLDWGLRAFRDGLGDLLPEPWAKPAWDRWIAWHHDSQPTEPEERPRCSLAEDPVDQLPVVIEASSGFGEAVKLPYPINTPCAEDAMEITPDGTHMYFWWNDDDVSYSDVVPRTFTHTMTVYSRLTEYGWTFPRVYDLTLGDDYSLNGETTHTTTGEVFFHSLRADNVGQPPYPPGQEFDIDVYVATIDGYTPTDIVHLGDPINTEYIDGEGCTSHDGQILFIGSNRPGSLGDDLDIFVSYRDGSEWSEPDNAGEMININTEAKEYQPALSPDGRYLYFVSDRRVWWYNDIYRSEWEGSSWGEPELICKHCGGPSITSDGCMYFIHVKTTDWLANTKADADIWVTCPE